MPKPKTWNLLMCIQSIWGLHFVRRTTENTFNFKTLAQSLVISLIYHIYHCKNYAYNCRHHDQFMITTHDHFHDSYPWPLSGHRLAKTFVISIHDHFCQPQPSVYRLIDGAIPPLSHTKAYLYIIYLSISQVRLHLSSYS